MRLFIFLLFTCCIGFAQLAKTTQSELLNITIPPYGLRLTKEADITKITDSMSNYAAQYGFTCLEYEIIGYRKVDVVDLDLTWSAFVTSAIAWGWDYEEIEGEMTGIAGIFWGTEGYDMDVMTVARFSENALQISMCRFTSS